MSYNIPQGCENDINAPWNEKEEPTPQTCNLCYTALYDGALACQCEDNIDTLLGAIENAGIESLDEIPIIINHLNQVFIVPLIGNEMILVDGIGIKDLVMNLANGLYPKTNTGLGLIFMCPNFSDIEEVQRTLKIDFS